MKTRNGFVSNSSSSSFVIVGFSLPSKFNYVKELLNDIKPLKKKIRGCKHSETKNNFCPKCGIRTWTETFIDQHYKIEKKISEELNIQNFRLDSSIVENELVIGIELIESRGTRSNEFNISKISEELNKIREFFNVTKEYKEKIFSDATSIN